jgi:AraC-like DNA-binding protein
LILGEATYQPLVSLGVIDPTRLTYQVGVDPELIRLWSKLYESIASREKHSWNEVLLDLTSLLYQLRLRAAHSAADGSELLMKACTLLENNLDERVSLVQISKALGMSLDGFRKWFTRNTGASPGAYRIEHRVQRACQLLRDHAIKEVAYDLGYPDTQSFAKQFHRHAGMTPKTYQKIFRP